VVPNAASTLPSGSAPPPSCIRGTRIDAVFDHVPVVGSHSSALAIGPP
jgi:hypothetical protein